MRVSGLGKLLARARFCAPAAESTSGVACKSYLAFRNQDFPCMRIVCEEERENQPNY